MRLGKVIGQGNDNQRLVPKIFFAVVSAESVPNAPRLTYVLEAENSRIRLERAKLEQEKAAAIPAQILATTPVKTTEAIPHPALELESTVTDEEIIIKVSNFLGLTYDGAIDRLQEIDYIAARGNLSFVVA